MGFILEGNLFEVVGGGTTTYVYEDFTQTTTGDLGDNNLTTDELGSGWVGDTAAYQYQASNIGVAAVDNAETSVVVQTDGREDVQVTATGLETTVGAFDNRWAGVYLRATGSALGAGISVAFHGGASDPDLVLRDGDQTETILKTWDLSALLTTQPVDGDEVDLVMRCDGDVITFYSIAVNGGSVEVVDDDYTLTGAAATAHGAGSGADYYGLCSRKRSSPYPLVESFTVESL